MNADGTIQLAPYGTGERVGIGTTLPLAKLHVQGDVRVSGASTFVGLVELDSSLRDYYGNVGTAGSILTVVGAGIGVSWTTPFAAGIQGTQGLQGVQGLQGTQGTQGISNQGTQGTQGLQGGGGQGTQGTQGLSNQGTQGTQGISNQGTQGTQGISNQGSQGLQGTQGLQGSQGSQGLQGLQGGGGQGSQGLQGTQGLSNQGSQGLQGLQGGGGQGSQGLQGLQGLSNQGTQGLQGLQGLSNQGTQGLQGVQGRQGVQGLQGLQGGNDGGVTVVNDEATNAIRFIGFTTVTSGISTIVGISSTKLVFNPSTGNLGIGNTNPGAKLDVAGDIRLSAADPEIELNSGGPRLKVPSANTLTIHTGGGLNTTSSEVVRINNTGVGLGTTNPVATLQVKDALAFETTNTTTTSTTQVAVDTFATATFRSAKYHVQLTCPGQISTLGGITTGGRGYTAGTFNITFTTSSGTGSAAQGTLTISNGTVGALSIISGGSGYAAGDVLTASGGSGLQVSVGTTDGTGAILTLGSITSAGIGYTAGVGVGTTTLTFLGGTGSGATGLATIFDGVITSSTLLQQPTTGTGGTVFYSGSNYSTASVLSVDRTALTNTITTITTDLVVGISTFTALTAHGLFVNDIIRTSSTSNGLTAGSDYYVVTVPSTTTFTLGTSVGIGTTFTAGSSLSIGFYRNSANAGGQVAYTNAITGVSTNYQVSDILVLQDGTTTDFVEYAGIANNDVLGTFSADISGANARLLLTPTYPNNNVKVARQVMTI